MRNLRSLNCCPLMVIYVWYISGSLTRVTLRVPQVKQELITIPEISSTVFRMGFVYCSLFSFLCSVIWSLYIFLSFLFWSMCCLFFFNLRLLVISLASSHFFNTPSNRNLHTNLPLLDFSWYDSYVVYFASSAAAILNSYSVCSHFASCHFENELG